MDEIPATAYPGLMTTLERSRAERQPEPVTLEDCRRALAFLRDGRMVENATHIRCYEFLIHCASQPIPVVHKAPEPEIEREADRYQAMLAVLRPYAWLATSRGCHAYDEHDAYEADVRALVNGLLECIPPHRAEPFQSVLMARNRLVREVERMRRGDFTPEEIHGFCHKLPETVSREEFAEGCRAYREKLYGAEPAPMLPQSQEVRCPHCDEFIGDFYGLFDIEPLLNASIPRCNRRSDTDRRQSLPAPEGKAIRARAPGDRRTLTLTQALAETPVAPPYVANRRTHPERRVKSGPRPPSQFDTRERRQGGDRRKG